MSLDEVKAVFRRYIYKADRPMPIGRDGRIRVSYFLDLMSASHDAVNQEILARYFSSWIQHNVVSDSYGAIVAPKRGNVLLAYKMAHLLNKRSGFVKGDILFGRWIEGKITSGDSVLLLDDIASDGELLSDSLDALQRSGIYVHLIAVLVDRLEGDARKFVENLNVRYEFCMQLNDADLEALLM